MKKFIKTIIQGIGGIIANTGVFGSIIVMFLCIPIVCGFVYGFFSFFAFLAELMGMSPNASMGFALFIFLISPYLISLIEHIVERNNQKKEEADKSQAQQRDFIEAKEKGFDKK